MSGVRLLSCGAVVWLMLISTVHAQRPDGYVSLQADMLPHVVHDDGSARSVSELRARVLFDDKLSIGQHLRLTASVFAEGLVADRVSGVSSRDAIVRPQELHAEFAWSKAEVRVGFTRVVWGRLDEFLPTDVVNPQDLSRFLFEGRTEGRMPVALARFRWLPSDRYTVEGIVVPFFRAGRFDQLDEATSPFNFAPAAGCSDPGGCVPIVIDEQEPSRSVGHVQGGGRFSATSGRVDWSVSTYRGFEPLPLYSGAAPITVDAIPAAIGLDARHPRFTMVGGDVETVSGEWGIRGEVAAFPERSLQVGDTPVVVAGQRIEAGAGVDRKAGAYRLSGNVVVARQWADVSGSAADRTDVTLVASADRSFARETRRMRMLGVDHPSDQTVFVRGIAEVSLRDNLSLEASGGLFAGDGLGPLGRLATSDFVYLRLKVFY